MMSNRKYAANKNDAEEFPLCSIVIVNYNGKKYLERCLRSFEASDYPADRIEILLVDNGSEDSSETDAQASHPEVTLLRNLKNGFAAGLNLGISQAKGKYIAFANNDVFVDPAWLSTLVQVLEKDKKVGCVGGKVVFENGRINSVGHKGLPDYYWEDEGYDQEDRGQYDTLKEVKGLCWAAVLFRRECLDDIGPIDEDYVLYYEDVDTSLRCRQQGWKLIYSPKAVVRHVFHGSGNGSALAEYYCDRGRLIYVAKHYPDALPAAAQNTRFIQRGDTESLYATLPILVKKLSENHASEIFGVTLEKLINVLTPVLGALALDNLLARMQVVLGHRKMSIGIYDQALHVIGGGQKYGCTIASVLQEHFNVTLITNRPVEIATLEKWYQLPLSKCQIEVITLSYFDRNGSAIDSNIVMEDDPNPFNAIAGRSKEFDVFINANMLTMVRPLSPFSIFICHFPDTPRRCYFASHEYSYLVANSLYTAQWTRLLWGLDPDLLLYPAVEMEKPQKDGKENIILSAARFEPGGSKKQLELIKAFERLVSSHQNLMQDWRLILVGGSTTKNHYLEAVKRAAKKSTLPIEVRFNVSFSELQDCYSKAKIFWHACGIGETNPRLIEHFGMTTVESMQNQCVPVVIDGGGQREIVEHGRSGYRFSSYSDLCRYTHQLISDPGLMERMSEAAYQRSQEFTLKRFEETVNCYFQSLETEYCNIPVPDPQMFLRKKSETNIYYSLAARRDSKCLQK